MDGRCRQGFLMHWRICGLFGFIWVHVRCARSLAGVLLVFLCDQGLSGAFPHLIL
jgi:hypothetical protein